eukprot:945402-Pyramimonas_sp.AAC.1
MAAHRARDAGLLREATGRGRCDRTLFGGPAGEGWASARRQTAPIFLDSMLFEFCWLAHPACPPAGAARR